MPKLLIKSGQLLIDKSLILKDNCQLTGPDEICLNLVDPEEAYEVSPGELKIACDRFQTILNDPNTLEQNRSQFVRAAFFDINDLQDVVTRTRAQHVKIYYGIDREGKNFMFIAPIYPDGRALEDDDTIAALCCCSVPPCPSTLRDRYVNH
ncbi:hypothetical protein [Spirosoma areae]